MPNRRGAHTQVAGLDLRGGLQLGQIRADKLAGRSVEPVGELSQQRLVLAVRVLEQLDHHPDLEVSHVSQDRVLVLREDALDVVLGVKPVVGRVGVDRRQRQAVPGGVRDGVVPDPQVLADLRPAEQVVAEPAVLPMCDGLGEVAGRIAEADDDVVPRPEGLGRLLRHHVGERVDEDVGVLVLDRIGHGVDEVQQRPDLGSFGLGDGLALRALAHAPPVVLRDVEHDRRGSVRFPRGGVGRLDVGQELPGKLAAHLRIRQTELRPIVRPLALDQ